MGATSHFRRKWRGGGVNAGSNFWTGKGMENLWGGGECGKMSKKWGREKGQVCKGMGGGVRDEGVPV